MVDPKAHQLYKQVTGCTTQYRSEGSVIVGSSGWEIIRDDANMLILAHRTYIDLQGWSAQDLTTFTQGVDIQKQLMPTRSLTASGMLTCDEFDFITTRKLTDTELDFDVTLGGEESVPGFANSTCDLMQLIYGERMQYAVNTPIQFTYIQTSGTTSGSGNPTAMNRMHWTRLFLIRVPTNLDGFTIYPTNLVVQAMTVEEKDLIWYERIRRSYMHQDRAGI